MKKSFSNFFAKNTFASINENFDDDFGSYNKNFSLIPMSLAKKNNLLVFCFKFFNQ